MKESIILILVCIIGIVAIDSYIRKDTTSTNSSEDYGGVKAWNTRHIPEGYMVVPEEPTDAMLERGLAYCGTRSSLDQAYAAMLQAAQKSSDVTKDGE